jgi:hypothetical protein
MGQDRHLGHLRHLQEYGERGDGTVAILIANTIHVTLDTGSA